MCTKEELHNNTIEGFGITRICTNLLPCPDPSLCASSANTAKDAWAQAAATLGPTAEARKAT